MKKKEEREIYLKVIEHCFSATEQKADTPNSSEFEWTRENIHEIENKVNSIGNEWGIWKEQTRNQPGLNIDYFNKKVKTLIEENIKLRAYLGEINTRLSNLEKKTFEILPEKKVSKVGQNQAGKKRGPYKKTKKASTPKKDEPHNELGVKTINKYLRKIENVLNNTVHFTKKELITEVRVKIPGTELAKMSGKDVLKVLIQARWRLDGRRRRDLKLGVYAKKADWKKKGQVYVSDK